MVRIAIVDDAPEIRLLHRLELSANGFEVCAEGSDGYEAVEIARNEQPDVMLLDVSMPPGIDGLTALPLILAESPGTQVVLLSGLDDPEVADRACAQGAAGCLVKRLRERPLSACLRELLGTTPDV